MRISDKCQCNRRLSIQKLTKESVFAAERLTIGSVFWNGLNAYVSGDQDVFHRELQRQLEQVPYRLSYEREDAIESNAFKMERLVRYILSNGSSTLIRAGLTVETPVGDDKVVALMKETATGNVHAYMMMYGTNTFSNKARKVENLPMNSVRMRAIAYALHEEYPYLTVHMLGYTSKDDSGTVKVPELKTKDEAYYNFHEDLKNEQYLSRLQEDMKTASVHECTKCPYDGVYCNLAPYTPITEEVVTVSRREPTAAQEAIIKHGTGPAVVSACPGSGKTFTLIKRLERLVLAGVPAEEILLITFTRSAARELRKRFKQLNLKGEPEISTIHSLCLQILRSAVKGELKVSKKSIRYSVIGELLEKYSRMSGVNYTNAIGEYGIISTLDRAFTLYGKGFSDEEVAAEVAPLNRMSMEQVRELYGRYLDTMKEKGFIGYDDLLILALDYLQNKPKVLRMWASRYQYIMVDEYQDVDGLQDAICKLLASQTENLMVVGDDDQSIYGWRGGSNEYMLNKAKEYADIKEYVLADNFRSTYEIVSASANLINFNEQRIKKPFRANRHGEPVAVENAGKQEISGIIRSLMDKGYKAGDIAIIARTNAELADVQKCLNVPSRLNRTFIWEDPVFRTILAVVALKLEPDVIDADYFLELVAHHAQEVDIAEIDESGAAAFINPKGKYYPSFERLWSIIDGITFVKDIHETLSRIVHAFYAINEHPVIDEIMDYVKSAGVDTLDDLYGVLKMFREIKDDTRVTYPIARDRVTLLTAHDSKGLEFPCVILLNLDGFGDYDEEARRLLYVAITRAEDQLIICIDPGNRSNRTDYLSQLGLIQAAAQ